ncbi:MAG: ribose 5-phosphate isomerase B [Bacteroidetes bacterium GWA2_32_17]|nr:MAG: ribose 5-phosphate isomerase B [Bacteroidetes bacterium GWA2_32_17]
MKISIASDHAGFELKLNVLEFLKSKIFEIKDNGCFSSESVDYPDFAHKVAIDVTNKKVDFGIVICGSGNGVNMVVNKYPEIRGALCWNVEISKLARVHNNANICALPARFISKEEAILIVETFLTTNFEGGRHQKRIEKIPISK